MFFNLLGIKFCLCGVSEQMLLSVASGSRQSLGTVASHKHHYILLQFSSHLLIPIFLPLTPHHSFPLFHHRWWTGKLCSHYWSIYMTPSSISGHSTQAITQHKLMVWGEGRTEKHLIDASTLNICQSEFYQSRMEESNACHFHKARQQIHFECITNYQNYHVQL